MTAQETNGKNFFEVELTAELGSTDLTLNVDAFSGLSVPFYVVLGPDIPARREITLIDSSVTGTTMVMSNINKRYLTGSAAGSGITHPVGEKVRFSPVWQQFEDINDRVDAVAGGALTLVNAAGDLVYGSADNTLARLAVGTARQNLAVNAGATAPEWVASMQSLLTAQGDIIYASAANTPARLAKGTAAQVLTMNAGATAPEWAAVSGASVPANAAAFITNDESTTSTSYTDLASSGPAVTVVTGTKALITLTGSLRNNTGGASCFMSVAVSGASTVAASTDFALVYESPDPGESVAASYTFIMTGLTAGSNTFTAKYQVGAGTGNFDNRRISVVNMGS